MELCQAALRKYGCVNSKEAQMMLQSVFLSLLNSKEENEAAVAFKCLVRNILAAKSQ